MDAPDNTPSQGFPPFPPADQPVPEPVDSTLVPSTPPAFPDAGTTPVPPGYPSTPGYPGTPGYSTTAGYPGTPGYSTTPGYPGTAGYPGAPASQNPPAYSAPPAYLPASATVSPWEVPPPVAAPPRKRRRWLVPTVVAVVLVAAGGGIYVFTRHSSPAKPVAQVSIGPTTPASTPTTVTTPKGPPSTINDLMDAQKAALLAGDEKAFMATVDPAAKPAVTAFRRLYRNMQALNVKVWDPSTPDGSVKITRKKTTTVNVDVCVADATCNTRESVAFVVSVAPHKGGPLLESLIPPARSAAHGLPYPWMVSALHVVSGGQVYVAATDDEAGQLASMLPHAESAAKVVEKYAGYFSGTGRTYVVYLAGHKEASQWFGGLDRNDIGAEIPLGPAGDYGLLVVLPEAQTFGGLGGVEATMRTELGYVALLSLSQDPQIDSVIEGMDEYMTDDGHPSWAGFMTTAARSYINAGKWSGQCYLTKDATSNTLSIRNGARGIGYLLIKFLVAKYGLDTTMKFVGSVVTHGNSVETASTDELGVSWKSVNTHCVSYVHHSTLT